MTLQISVAFCLLCVIAIAGCTIRVLKGLTRHAVDQRAALEAIEARIREERRERLRDATAFAHELHNLRIENAKLRDWITAHVGSRV